MLAWKNPRLYQAQRVTEALPTNCLSCLPFLASLSSSYTVQLAGNDGDRACCSLNTTNKRCLAAAITVYHRSRVQADACVIQPCRALSTGSYAATARTPPEARFTPVLPS
jgi:hypothetical protein